MGNPNQAAQPELSKNERVEIRMKPGCGRMLIGRHYILADENGGTKKTTKRPKLLDDVLEVEDEWLGARKIGPNGQPLDGPTAIVPVSLIESYLKDGKPTRIIEGYPMQKCKGSDVTEDEHGNPVAPVEDTFKPGRISRRQDNSLIASHPDCTFEIVRRVA